MSMARGGKSKNLSGGLPLPDEVLDDYPRLCVVFQCPDEPEIVRSVLGHIWDLGRWNVWEKGGYGDTRATRMARQFKNILLDTLRIRECDDMSACCDNLLSEVRQIKALLNAIERRQAQDDAATIINNYTSYWNNPATIVEVQYPDAPDVTLEQKTGDTPQQQARRRDSVCYLARVLTDMAYEVYRRDKASSSFLANLAISVSGLVLSVAMFFSTFTGWGLVMSLILGLAKVSQDTKDNITSEDLADNDVKNVIQCKLRKALRNASPTATAIKSAVTVMPDGAAERETRMTQAVREIIVNTDDTALQNSVKAALSEAMSPLNVVPPCPCEDDALYVIVRCATNVTVGGSQAESLGDNVWRFYPPSPGTVIAIESNVPPNVSAFDTTSLPDAARFNKVTLWYYSDLRPITLPASYITLTNVWYVQDCYTDGTGAEYPPQGGRPTNAVAYPYNTYAPIVISFNW